MPKFIVKVELTIGEYEKSTVHLIEAETKAHATLQAMADESHGYGNVDKDGVWWDCNGEMAYRVYHCQELSDEQADVITGLKVHYLSHFDSEQIKELLSDDAEKDIDTLLSYM